MSSEKEDSHVVPTKDDLSSSEKSLTETETEEGNRGIAKKNKHEEKEIEDEIDISSTSTSTSTTETSSVSSESDKEDKEDKKEETISLSSGGSWDKMRESLEKGINELRRTFAQSPKQIAETVQTPVNTVGNKLADFFNRLAPTFQQKTSELMGTAQNSFQNVVETIKNTQVPIPIPSDVNMPQIQQQIPFAPQQPMIPPAMPMQQDISQMQGLSSLGSAMQQQMPQQLPMQMPTQMPALPQMQPVQQPIMMTGTPQIPLIPQQMQPQIPQVPQMSQFAMYGGKSQKKYKLVTPNEKPFF